MSKLKLISVLQSRIAKRRSLLASSWELFEELKTENINDSKVWKVHLLDVGNTQKEDKQLLKQLVEDERSIKEWKARFDTASKALGIIAGMRVEL